MDTNDTRRKAMELYHAWEETAEELAERLRKQEERLAKLEAELQNLAAEYKAQTAPEPTDT